MAGGSGEGSRGGVGSAVLSQLLWYRSAALSARRTGFSAADVTTGHIAACELKVSSTFLLSTASELQACCSSHLQPSAQLQLSISSTSSAFPHCCELEWAIASSKQTVQNRCMVDELGVRFRKCEVNCEQKDAWEQRSVLRPLVPCSGTNELERKLSSARHSLRSHTHTPTHT
jgi:hypothetical protein